MSKIEDPKIQKTFLEEFGKKPLLNIGTIGHIDHGKTTLTAAITKVLSQTMPDNNEAKRFDEIDKGKEEKLRGITINATCVKYETLNYVCSHVDCPGHQDFIKNFISGIKPMDACILVVDADAGVMKQTVEHVLLVKQKPIKDLIVFLNKIDATDPEFVELSEAEIIGFLDKQGYKNVKIVKGSAKLALEGHKTSEEENIGKKAVMELINAIDALDVQGRSLDAPFKMAIDNRYSIKGRGVVLTGVPQRGKVENGKTLELHYKGKEPKKVVIVGIESYHKSIAVGVAGANLGVLVRGLKEDEGGKGAYITELNSHEYYDKFLAKVYIQTGKDGDGGRGKAVYNKFCPQFCFSMHDHVTGQIVSINGDKSNNAYIKPGEVCEMEVHLVRPTAFDKHLAEQPEGGIIENIIIREGIKNVGTGFVTKLLK